MIRGLFIFVLPAFLSFAGMAFAEEIPDLSSAETSGTKSTFFQVCVCPAQPSIQLFDEKYSVNGLRVNLVSGYNEAVYGLDVGLVGGCSKAQGLQLNLLLNAAEEFKGMHAGLLNASRKMTGIEAGIFNGFPLYDMLDFDPKEEDHLKKGLQIGLINWAAYLRGVQIGILNRAQYLDGLQIGLVNWNKEHDFIPLINFKNQF